MSLSDTVKAQEAALAELFHEDLVPWARRLFGAVAHAEVAALMPIASSAAGALAAELATNQGDPKAFAASVAKVLASVAEQAKDASGHALLAAVAAAIVSHSAAVGLGGEALPETKEPPPNPVQDEQVHTNVADNASGVEQPAAPTADEQAGKAAS